MDSHTGFGASRLGGFSLLLAILCSLGLSGQRATAVGDDLTVEKAHAVAAKQKAHAEARPAIATANATAGKTVATAAAVSAPAAAELKEHSEVRTAAAHAKPLEILPNDSAEAGMLREAYARLAVADHDYKGHRAKAMAKISEAAKAFGVELKGDGKAHEPQATSDEHLHAAQGLLDRVVGAVGGPGLNHVKLAIEQISLALAVR